MSRGRKVEVPPIPEVIETAEDRGTVLKAWLVEMGLSQSGFADNMGISRNMLSKYFRGISDIADMTTETADRLLRAMGISDREAWELLQIPEARRSTFRSLRPWPLGHGTEQSTYGTEINLQLTEPMFGSVALPAGPTLIICPDDTELPHQVYKLADGRLYAVEADSALQASGTRIGGLSSVVFSKN